MRFDQLFKACFTNTACIAPTVCYNLLLFPQEDGNIAQEIHVDFSTLGLLLILVSTVKTITTGKEGNITKAPITGFLFIFIIGQRDKTTVLQTIIL